MIKSVNIKNDKKIGKEYPTFLIAEMACAHQGDLQNALDLVKVAADSKADSIQLQVFNKEDYISPINVNYDLVSRLELSQSEWLEVIDQVKKTNLLFFAAGYDKGSVKFLIENDVDAFKVHSSDTSNPEVLEEVAKSNKPVFLSCGASKVSEIKKALDLLRKYGTDDIVLMHGYQAYPTKIEDTHLNFIKTLERMFGLHVGFYDHVDGGSILSKIIPIMAIGYGAQVIEKHFILRRSEEQIDYESSLNPEDFKDFVKNLRTCEKAIGSKSVKSFTTDELSYRATCKKSIVAGCNINEGEKITREKVMFLRSDPGIPPDKFKKIENKIAKKDIKKYHNITDEDY